MFHRPRGLSRRVLDGAGLLLPLAGAGAVIGHGLGYGMAGLPHPDGHGHLSSVGPLVTMIGGAALATGAIRSLRRAELRPTARGLLTLQVPLYVGLEIAEHTAGALEVSGLVSGPVLAGLVAQLPVAWVLARLFEITRTVVERILAASPRVTARPIVARPALTRPVWSRTVARPGPPRGPPAVVVP